MTEYNLIFSDLYNTNNMNRGEFLFFKSTSSNLQSIARRILRENGMI